MVQMVNEDSTHAVKCITSRLVVVSHVQNADGRRWISHVTVTWHFGKHKKIANKIREKKASRTKMSKFLESTTRGKRRSEKACMQKDSKFTTRVIHN